MRRLPTLAVAALSIAIGLLIASLLYKHAWRIPVVQNLRDTRLFCALWILATPVAALLTTLARIAPWRTALKSAALCLAIAVPAYGITGTFEKVRTSSRDKAVLCNLRQLAAAADQYFLENGVQVVERYEDLVGPTKYIKAQHPVAGEDYRTNFPLRQGAILSADFPSGRIINYASGPTPPGYKHIYEAGETPPWRVKKSAANTHGLPADSLPAAPALTAEEMKRLTQPAHKVRRGTMCASCHAKKT
jgi:type IV pilus assembly protein PilA